MEGKDEREADGAEEKREPDGWFGTAGEEENPGEREEEGEEEIEQELPPGYDQNDWKTFNNKKSRETDRKR